MSDFYTSTANIAHKMLHMTYAKLDAESKRKVQHRAEALIEFVNPVTRRDDDLKSALELIRASLRQILEDKPSDETGDVDTFEMCNAALNIYSILAT